MIHLFVNLLPGFAQRLPPSAAEKLLDQYNRLINLTHPEEILID